MDGPSGPATREDSFAGRLRVKNYVTEWRFWIVQTLVVLLTALHVGVEWLDTRGQVTGILEGIQDLPVPGYVVPILLAGVWYGIEGGVATAVATVALSVPNLVQFHRTDYAWLGELTTNVLVAGTGIVIGASIHRLEQARSEAEAANGRLRLLRDVGDVIRSRSSHEALVTGVVEVLSDSTGVAAAFVPDDPAGEMRTVVAGGGPAAGRLNLLVESTDSEPQSAAGQLDVRSFPVATDRAAFGTLVLACDGQTVCDEDASVVSLIASELADAVERIDLLEHERSELHRYARGVTTAQERERKRIGRDLHDGPAQSMIVLYRGLTRLSNESPAELTSLASDLREEAKTTLESIRRTTQSLRPPLLDDLGLVAAVRSLADRRSASSSIRVEVTVDGSVRRLPAETELAAYRIAQEALTNVARHAEASSVLVRLAYTEHECRVSITDDGIGFDPDAASMDDRFGLTTMRERAELAGGSFHIESAPEAGSTVEFTYTG